MQGEEILALGKRFTALDTEGLGRLDFDTFVEGVGLDPHSSVSRRLFVLFDTDGVLLYPSLSTPIDEPARQRCLRVP